MTGKIAIDQPLTDCEVGVPKELKIICTPTSNDAQTGFQADVTEVPDYEEDSGDYAKEESPKGMEKHAPAVVIAIASKKK